MPTAVFSHKSFVWPSDWPQTWERWYPGTEEAWPEILLVIDPFEIGEGAFSVAPLWLTYCRVTKAYQSSRLGVIGFERSHDQSNFLLSARVPTQNQAFLAGLSPAIEAADPPQYGIDLRLRIADFVRGHGKDYFYEHLHHMHTRLYRYEDQLAQGQPWADVLATVDQDWLTNKMKLFRERWERYLPYLQLLPPAWQPDHHQRLLAGIDRYLDQPSALTPESVRELITGFYNLRKMMDAIRRVLSNSSFI